MQHPQLTPAPPDPTAWEPFTTTPNPSDDPLRSRVGAWAAAGMVLLTIVRGKRGQYRAVWTTPTGGFLTAFDPIDPLLPGILGPRDATAIDRVFQLLDEFEYDNAGDRELTDRQAAMLGLCLQAGLR